MSSDILHKPQLYVGENKKVPRLGTKVKLSDETQTFFVIVKQINGKMLIGIIDNYITDQKYNYGDQVLFFVENIIA